MKTALYVLSWILLIVSIILFIVSLSMTGAESHHALLEALTALILSNGCRMVSEKIK